MEDIRFYDYEFNLLYIENRVKSANWSIYYNDVGKFELHFDVENTKLVDVVMNSPNIVAVQGDLQAVITGRQFADEGILYGKTPNYLLYNGVTPEFQDLKSDIETMARQFVSASCGFMTLGPMVGYTTQIAFWRNTYHPTFDVVKDCLDTDGGGHNVVFDPINRQWVFNVLKGTQLPLIISRGNKNVLSIEYTVDRQNYYTGGWYKETQQPDESGTTPDPVWKYITSDATKTGVYKRDCVLSADNEVEARQELDKKSLDQQTRAKTQRINWKTDYNLGDIVRVQNEIGRWADTTTQRIIGVELWFEDNNIGEQPILEVV